MDPTSRGIVLRDRCHRRPRMGTIAGIMTRQPMTAHADARGTEALHPDADDQVGARSV